VQVLFERYQMICRRNVVVTRNQGQTDRECYGFTSWQSAGGAPKDRRSRGHGAFHGRRTARPDRLRLGCMA
jgi:hypothetical protein